MQFSPSLGSFLYGIIAGFKKAGMLINWAHKVWLEREMAEEKKIHNNPVLCGIWWDSPALPLPYCGNGLSLPRFPEYYMCVIIQTALPKDTHKYRHWSPHTCECIN